MPSNKLKEACPNLKSPHPQFRLQRSTVTGCTKTLILSEHKSSCRFGISDVPLFAFTWHTLILITLARTDWSHRLSALSGRSSIRWLQNGERSLGLDWHGKYLCLTANGWIGFRRTRDVVSRVHCSVGGARSSFIARSFLSCSSPCFSIRVAPSFLLLLFFLSRACCNSTLVVAFKRHESSCACVH